MESNRGSLTLATDVSPLGDRDSREQGTLVLIAYFVSLLMALNLTVVHKSQKKKVNAVGFIYAYNSFFFFLFKKKNHKLDQDEI